jgi:hypothetical protein
MKGRQDNWGQRSARCQAERRSGASLHSPKAQSLRSFFCIQASKLSVKYSCDNAGGSEQRRLANLSSTTRWIFRGRKGKKVKIAKQNSALFPTACRPHMQLCEHRISPNVVYHQRLGGKVITGLYYMICTHTHTQLLLLACEILPLESHKRRVWMPTCAAAAANTHAKWRPTFWYCVSKFMATCLCRQKLVPTPWYWVIQHVVTHP